MQEFRRSATACGDMVNITFKIGAADWRHPLKVAFRSSESSWVMQTAANRYWRQGDSVVVVCYPFHMTVWLWWGWVGVFIRKRTVVGRRLQLAADADVRCGDQLTWLYGYNCSVVTVPGLVTTNALIYNCHTSLLNVDFIYHKTQCLCDPQVTYVFIEWTQKETERIPVLFGSKLLADLSMSLF